ncbi:MAG: DNA-directed DNA polymerase II small subunit [Candidatus Thermoplasmatota archaeon]|nr:DNA-directed DNA polymerase II small subunit [Candidatus Thermoplasmatota archaeon]
MKSIIQAFSEHGTFVQPNTLDYILSKENPEEFTTYLTKELKEYPLVLTLDHVKKIEETKDNDKISNPSDDFLKNKEIQSKILFNLYNPELKPKENIIENDSDQELIYVDDLSLDFKKLPKIDITSKSFEVNKIKTWKAFSKNFDSEIKIIKDITGKSTCEGTTNDFIKLFIDRFENLRKILKNQRREIANIIPINKINKANVKIIQIIGIIKEVRNTQNGHRLIEIEDDTGSAVAIALKNNPEVFQIAREIVLDEVVGIIGQLSKNGDLLVIQNIIYPDISIQNSRHKSEEPICAAFLSDIHIGSKEFLEKQWLSFIKWVNGQMGNSRQREVAGKIKYIVIPGDVVDGIGIYPNQEKELLITNLYKQYEVLADYINKIPEHISIIIQPGNHDAVRPAEPQPAFEKEIQNLFSGNDITFVGNPCYFSIHGIEVLSYHGQSLLDFATNIQHLKYNDPVEIMKIMLKKHHLAPSYGGYTPLAPEHKDYMIIDKIPDIFVTGHVHLATVGEYRGIKLINASSWQSQTSYQKMLNFIPDPAKIPIVNLKSGNITMMDFNKT